MNAAAAHYDRDAVKREFNDAQRAAELIGLEVIRREGANLKVRCPSHGGDSCNLSIADGTLRVKCYGCDLAGDVFNLVAAKHGKDVKHEFRDVLKIAADLAGVSPTESAPRAAHSIPREERKPDADVAATWAALPPAESDPDVYEYLAGRGLGEAMALCRAVPLLTPGVLGKHARDGMRLAQASYDSRGRVVAIQVRSLDGKTFRLLGPAKGGTFGEPASVASADVVVVAEGFTDTLAALSVYGADPKVAVVGIVGAESHGSLAHLNLAAKRVVIALDADDAGDAAAVAVAKMVHEAGGKPARLRPEGAKDLVDLLRAGADLRALVEKAPPVGADGKVAKPRNWISPAARARKVGNYGPRLATEFPSINVATRSGFTAGRVVGIGGAPGAGKTTLGMQFVRGFLDAGAYVAVLAADEDADGLLIRMGQAFGLDRDDLEGDDNHADPNRREYVRAAKIKLSDALAKYGDRFLLVDADEDGATIEEVSAELAKRRPAGAVSVFMADSVQTVRAAGTDDADGPRARADIVVSALKHAAKVDKHAVFATSEVARGYYRSGNEADRTAGLAAFKESGGIEYGIGFGLVLRSVKGSPDAVDAEIVKNRIGGTLSTFRLELNRRTATFREVERPTDEERDDEAERKAADLRDAVVAIVKATPGKVSGNTIIDVGRRKNIKASKAAWGVAIADAADMGLIQPHGAARSRSYSIGSEPVLEPDDLESVLGSRAYRAEPKPEPVVSDGGR